MSPFALETSTLVDVADDHRRQLVVTAQDHLEPIHGATQAQPTKAPSRLYRVGILTKQMRDSGLPADVLVGKLKKVISFALRRGTGK